MLGNGSEGGFSKTARSVATPTGRVTAIWKQLGATIGSWLSRYCDGVSPTMSRNVRLKVPRLVNPTVKHTSVTLCSVSRSRNIDRSTRRRCR